MDTAVALVNAYLHVNGYFTVTEYPVIEGMKDGGYRAATDLDVLAFRFPRAGRLVPGHGEVRVFKTDSALEAVAEQADMIIGEVKEGHAELNRGAREPAVLRTVLTRFGCCTPEEVPHVVDTLLETGHAVTHCSHRVRLVAFGSFPGQSGNGGYAVITLGHIADFLRDYIREYWDILRSAEFKDPAFSFLLMLEKARQGGKI